MAKSIRSKRKRKMRNIKRLTNGPKELKRLKKTLGLILDDDPKHYNFGDIREKVKKQKLNQASGVAYTARNVVGAEAEWTAIRQEVKARRVEKDRLKGKVRKEPEPENDQESEGGMDLDRPNLQVDPKTLQNKHGSYPAWMNTRHIMRIKSAKSGGKKLKKGQTRYAW